MTTFALIPGTFNPLHKGHLAIHSYCLNKRETPVFFIAKKPFDKVNVPNWRDRVDQINNLGCYYRVVKDKTFAAQITTNYNKLIKHGWNTYDFSYTLNIGIDTFVRLQDVSYYGSEEAFVTSVKNMNKHNLIDIRVFPRNGVKTVEVHPFLQELNLVTFVTDFEELNISSTELRNNAL